jgi:hypothetical protein
MRHWKVRTMTIEVCLAGDGLPLAVSREGCPTLLCERHVDLAQTLEVVDQVSRVDHLDAVVTWSNGLASFSQGAGVGVG